MNEHRDRGYHSMKHGTKPVRLFSALLTILVTIPVGFTSSYLPASSSRVEPTNIASNGECVCGPKRVSVLLFDFQDVRHNASRSPDTFKRILKEMNASFYLQSYGKMWLVGGEVYGWYNTSLRLIDFKKTGGWVDYEPEAQGERLQNVAFSKARDIGVKGYIMAVFPGPIWSWTYNKTISILAESDDVEFFMHEFGHLMGLRDLRNGLMRGWDLMDSETTRLSAWSRIRLGWLSGDAIAHGDPERPVSLLINLVDRPEGIRAVRIPAIGWPRYYLVEVRVKTEYDAFMFLYSVDTSDGEAEIPGAFKATLSTDLGWNRVFTRENFALILLDGGSNSVLVHVANKEIGDRARVATQALHSANASIRSALSSDRTQGLSEARQELEKAWEAYRKADFDSARSLAEKAKELADASTIPQPITEFPFLPPTVILIAVGLLVSVTFLVLRKRSASQQGRSRTTSGGDQDSVRSTRRCYVRHEAVGS